MSTEIITLGGGCFWCLDGAFRRINGIKKVRSGYSGGATEQPTYKEICTGQTGHAEVVQIEWDSDTLDVETILKSFFSLHDPTTLNRQGADIGSQYRSVIFYHSENQKAISQKMIDDINRNEVWASPVVTELSPVGKFYEAEEYHQNYYAENSTERYCQLIIEPKLKKFVDANQRLIG